MALHTIRVIKNGRTVQRKQFSDGLGRDAVVIQAQADATYLLSDPINNAGPSKISVKRVGENLHVALNKGNPDTPDLIIEGYFNFAPAPISGSLADGGQALYDLGSLSASSATAAVTDATMQNNSVMQASLPSEGLSPLTIGLVGLGGLALAAAGGGGGGGSAISSPPSTTDAASTALNKITTYANDGSQAAPTIADYADAGITAVGAVNLIAINSAVDTLSSTNVDSRVKLQAVVDAYNKILLEANGTAVDATPGSNPSANDYAIIGANIGTSVSNTTALSLLNGVIGNHTIASVDTIGEINAIATVVDKVMSLSSGTATTLTIADYGLLGLPTSGQGAVTSANLAAVNNTIATAGGPTKVDTYTELSNLVTAIATIVSYADDSSQAAPTLIHYTILGIANVSAINLGAINSAVEANSANRADTPAELQALVDSYNLILAEANGAVADSTPGVNPAAAQFALIGANIGAATTNTVNLSLLDDAIAGLVSASVDTIGEINDLAAATNAVMTGAAGGTAPTLMQLTTLGITGLTVNNILAIQNAIGATADSGLQVDTIAELQAVVNSAANAAVVGQTHIQNYAINNLSIAPTSTDYTNIGVTGVEAGNLGAINSAVDALSSSNVDTPYEVQTIINAYNRILIEANGAAPDATQNINPTANDYSVIGAGVGLASVGLASGNDLASNALALLDDAVANMTTASVDTVNELNAIGIAIDKVMNLAKLPADTATSAGSLTMADLNLLGINTALADTALEVDAILQAIIDSADTGSAANTIQALQALVNAHAS
jgi:hypothetical protein